MTRPIVEFLVEKRNELSNHAMSHRLRGCGCRPKISVGSRSKRCRELEKSFMKKRDMVQEWIVELNGGP